MNHCMINEYAITYEKITLRKTMVSEKESSDINFERLKKAQIYVKFNFIEFDNNMYLIVDSLIDTNNITTGWNNLTLRKPYTQTHTDIYIYIYIYYMINVYG